MSAQTSSFPEVPQNLLDLAWPTKDDTPNAMAQVPENSRTAGYVAGKRGFFVVQVLLDSLRTRRVSQSAIHLNAAYGLRIGGGTKCFVMGPMQSTTSYVPIADWLRAGNRLMLFERLPSCVTTKEWIRHTFTTYHGYRLPQEETTLENHLVRYADTPAAYCPDWPTLANLLRAKGLKPEDYHAEVWPRGIAQPSPTMSTLRMPNRFWQPLRELAAKGGPIVIPTWCGYQAHTTNQAWQAPCAGLSDAIYNLRMPSPYWVKPVATVLNTATCEGYGPPSHFASELPEAWWLAFEAVMQKLANVTQAETDTALAIVRRLPMCFVDANQQLLWLRGLPQFDRYGVATSIAFRTCDPDGKLHAADPNVDGWGRATATATANATTAAADHDGEQCESCDVALGADHRHCGYCERCVCDDCEWTCDHCDNSFCDSCLAIVRPSPDSPDSSDGYCSVTCMQAAGWEECDTCESMNHENDDDGCWYCGSCGRTHCGCRDRWCCDYCGVDICTDHEPACHWGDPDDEPLRFHHRDCAEWYVQQECPGLLEPIGQQQLPGFSVTV